MKAEDHGDVENVFKEAVTRAVEEKWAMTAHYGDVNDHRAKVADDHAYVDSTVEIAAFWALGISRAAGEHS